MEDLGILPQKLENQMEHDMITGIMELIINLRATKGTLRVDKFCYSLENIP